MSSLHKDSKNGKILGVCAGISEWLGLDVTLVRVLTVLSFFITGSVTFWAYLLAGILLPDENDS